MECNGNVNISMYPMISNTDDDDNDDDDDDDEFVSCVSDHNHLMPSTFVPSSYQQDYTSGINSSHPTTHSRK